MRILPFIISALITTGLIIVLNKQLPVGGNKTPRLGYFLSPQIGFWQNAESVNTNYNNDIKLTGLESKVEVYIDDRLVPHIYADNDSFIIYPKHSSFYIFSLTYFYTMKIALVSVGKAHELYLNDGIDDFTSRINKYFKADWQLITAPKNAANMSELELKKAEASLILQNIQKDDFLILLDERGKLLSSPEVANLLQQRANESTKRIIFLIGGAFGVDDSIIKRANFTWSLSKLVFPHMLVRLILAEQIYRACTILRNEKYHHV